MNLTDSIVPAYARMLRALSDWPGKAEAQRAPSEADARMSARLVPGMLPLSTPVRFACVQAREAGYRLTDTVLPDSLEDLVNEGRNGGERPGTLADARLRIAETIAFLDKVDPAALDAGEGGDVELALPMGLTFDMTGGQYARDWAQPQFCFHLMTAYAIVRQQGVSLAKADYVSYALGYLRGGNDASPVSDTGVNPAPPVAPKLPPSHRRCGTNRAAG